MFEKKSQFIPKLILWSLSIGLIFIGIWLVIKDKTASSTSCFAFGVILLLFANVERFEYFKGFGLEAKTRKLEQKLDEAEKLFSELKRLSLLSGSYIVDSATRQGLWNSRLKPKQLYALKNEVLHQLSDIGIDPIEIARINEIWVKQTLCDLRNGMIQELRNTFNEEALLAEPPKMQMLENYDKEILALNMIDPPNIRPAIKKVIDDSPIENKEHVQHICCYWLDEIDFVSRNNDLQQDSILFLT